MESSGRSELRIGHAERDQAVATLRDAAADGRLTLDELDVRIGVAMAARTAADLRPVLADLLPPAELEVAMNAGMFSFVIIKPEITPQSAETKRATTMPSANGNPTLLPRYPSTMLESANTEPTLRSMPPSRMTKVIPRAITPMTVI